MQMSTMERRAIAPKFDGKPQNWPAFKLKHTAFIYSLDREGGLVALLDGKRPRARDSDDDKKDHQGRNMRFYYALVECLDESVLHLIRPYAATADGQEAWGALMAKYESTGTMGLQGHIDMMMGPRALDKDDPDKLFSELETHRELLAHMKCDIPDPLMISFALRRLPPMYDNLQPILRTWDGDLTYDIVKAKVRGWWLDAKASGRPESREEKGFYGYGQPGKNEGKYNGKSNDKKELGPCHKCGKMGHLKFKCPQKEQQEESSSDDGSTDEEAQVTCQLCEQPGHSAKQCKPKLGQARYAGVRAQWN